MDGGASAARWNFIPHFGAPPFNSRQL